MNRLNWTARALIGIALACATASTVACDEAVQVAHDELGPRALLNKYMLLKEMHAQLDKKKADIAVYDRRFSNLKEQYTDEKGKPIPRIKWAREDRDQANMWEAEYAGVVASYNDLAAQYNAKMAEVNWSFCNVGTLPKGADETLPREYAPYQTK